MDKSYEYKIYLQSAILGSFRGLVVLPIEHPFDVIKTRMQSINQKSSIIKVTKDLYKDFGYKGFYAGVIPNSLRVFIKSFYRWPMMVAIPHYYKNYILPESIMQKYESSHKIGAGLTIAVFESFIICPFERLKVYLMTKNNKQVSLKHFFKNSDNKFSDLFLGLRAQLIKQIVSWVSFLYIDFKVKQFAKINFSDNGVNLSTVQLMCCAVTTGFLNTLCTHPVDKVKTLYQMQLNEQYKQATITAVFKQAYLQNGFASLYNGWQARLLQYITQSLFTCTLLERLEEKLNRVKAHHY
ncbi:hypothetical protein ABPG74_022197 [Tetrahymena malaccensis]